MEAAGTASTTKGRRHPSCQRSEGRVSTTPATPMAIPRGSAKGEWWIWLGQLWMRCPQCGLHARLADHTMSPEGFVQPSVVCDCGFHEYIKLADWEAA